MPILRREYIKKQLVATSVARSKCPSSKLVKKQFVPWPSSHFCFFLVVASCCISRNKTNHDWINTPPFMDSWTPLGAVGVRQSDGGYTDTYIFVKLIHIWSPIVISTKVGWPPKAPSPPLWRQPKAAVIMGDEMCIKYVRVHISSVGLTNPGLIHSHFKCSYRVPIYFISGVA